MSDPQLVLEQAAIEYACSVLRRGGDAEVKWSENLLSAAYYVSEHTHHQFEVAEPEPGMLTVRPRLVQAS